MGGAQAQSDSTQLACSRTDWRGMTEPIQSTSSHRYSCYDPEQEMSPADGTGGSSGRPPSVKEGSQGAPAGNESQPTAGELQCLSELLATGATCGSAYLTKNPLTTLGCVATANKLLECLT